MEGGGGHTTTAGNPKGCSCFGRLDADRFCNQNTALHWPRSPRAFNVECRQRGSALQASGIGAGGRGVCALPPLVGPPRTVAKVTLEVGLVEAAYISQ